METPTKHQLEAWRSLWKRWKLFFKYRLWWLKIGLRAYKMAAGEEAYHAEQARERPALVCRVETPVCRYSGKR